MIVNIREKKSKRKKIAAFKISLKSATNKENLFS